MKGVDVTANLKLFNDLVASIARTGAEHAQVSFSRQKYIEIVLSVNEAAAIIWPSTWKQVDPFSSSSFNFCGIEIVCGQEED